MNRQRPHRYVCRAFDDFEDGDSDNWDLLNGGGWMVVNGMVRPTTPSGSHKLALTSVPVPTHLVFEFDYVAHTLTGSNYVSAFPRFYANGDRVNVRFLPGEAQLYTYDDSTATWTQEATDPAIDTNVGQVYRVRIVYQGQRLRVLRRAVGPPALTQTWRFVFGQEHVNLLPDPPQNDQVQFRDAHRRRRVPRQRARAVRVQPQRVPAFRSKLSMY